MNTHAFVPTTPRRSRRPRTCIICRAPYHAPGTLWVDPRCPVCAVVLANRDDRDAELGGMD